VGDYLAILDWDMSVLALDQPGFELTVWVIFLVQYIKFGLASVLEGDCLAILDWDMSVLASD
jgi:hypothetical protein